VFIVLMHLADSSKAPDHVDGHKAWIRQGEFQGDRLGYQGEHDPEAIPHE